MKVLIGIKNNLFYDEPTDLYVSYKGIFRPFLELEYLPCNTTGCLPLLKCNIDYLLPSNHVWPFKTPDNIVLFRQP